MAADLLGELDSEFTNMWRISAKSSKLISLIAFVLLGAWLVGQIRPRPPISRPNFRRTGCDHTVKQLFSALSGYAASHDGALPPPFTVDSAGQPLHSWRTLLLPYLDHGETFRKIRFNEPWDFPHNSQFHDLFDKTVNWFRCAETGSLYMAILGPDAAWIDPGQPFMHEMDQQVPIVMEVVDSSTHWMEPRDYTVGEAAATLEDSMSADVNRRRLITPSGVIDCSTTSEAVRLTKLLSRHK